MRVAILGAGSSGLVAIKSCLEEGLEPVCFERNAYIGGLWHYTEDVTDGQGSVAKTTVTNTSKEIMCYSDFPVPSEFPNYMHHTAIIDYYRMYAKKFDLEKHIRFNVEVKRVARAKDFATSGRWDLDVHNRVTGELKTETVDAVLLCTGHHADKYVPHIEGDDVFKGKIMHSVEYRGLDGFEDKTIVIIGIGNSAGDAAVDFSRIAKQVYLSTRTGTWIINRLGDEGIPTDTIVLTRFGMAVLNALPTSWLLSYIEGKVNKRFNHALYGLKPKHRYTQQHPMGNDELPYRILCGRVVVKPDVKRFTETGVEFKDGTVVEDVDVIFLGTGYVFGFPYLEKGVIEVDSNKVNLFNYVFPPDLEQPTLGIIGYVQPVGAVNPISELQCRWATRVFKGRLKLPSKDDMWENIRQKQMDMVKRYVTSQRHTIQVDMIPFMDELAGHIGCKPNIVAMFLRDPKLALALLFGTWAPYQYRLQGPGHWSGARETILTIRQRILAPLSTRQVAPLSTRPAELEVKKNWRIMKLAMLALLVAVVYMWLLAP